MKLLRGTHKIHYGYRITRTTRFDQHRTSYADNTLQRIIVIAECKRTFGTLLDDSARHRVVLGTGYCA